MIIGSCPDYCSKTKRKSFNPAVDDKTEFYFFIILNVSKSYRDVPTRAGPTVHNAARVTRILHTKNRKKKPNKQINKLAITMTRRYMYLRTVCA